MAPAAANVPAFGPYVVGILESCFRSAAKRTPHGAPGQAMAPGNSKKADNAIDKLEKRTLRRIGIETNEDEASGKYDEQDASPLFSVLPRELRDSIWAFATAPFEDENEKFAENAYYCRPGHQARLKTDTALLRTCRRVWLEANALPMLQAEHSFYYHRAAPDARNPAWTAALTEQNRQDFGHLHLYAQMYAIENLAVHPGYLRTYFLKTQPVPGDFQPRVFHVTLRHTDWYFWESEEDLRLDTRWVDSLLNSRDLRGTHILKLELETLDYKVHQLRPIVDRIKQVVSAEKETHLIDGKPAKTMFVLDEQEATYNWEGPADINSGNYQPYEGKTRLKYHVETLTWRLRFPQIPRAFVPELRRAPRLPSTGQHYYENKDWVTADTMGDGTSFSQHHLKYIAYANPLGARARRRLRRHGIMRSRDDHDAVRYVQMKWLYREIQYNTQLQASMTEASQRRLFGEAMGEGIAGKLLGRWESEKSLLKFLPPLAKLEEWADNHQRELVYD